MPDSLADLEAQRAAVQLQIAQLGDMRSGSITLWIAGDGDAERARQLIEDLGFPAAVVEA